MFSALHCKKTRKARLSAQIKLPSQRQNWHIEPANYVRPGSEADRPLCAMCGRLSVGKGILMFCPSVGAAMCAAC